MFLPVEFPTIVFSELKYNLYFVEDDVPLIAGLSVTLLLPESYAVIIDVSSIFPSASIVERDHPT